MEGLKKPIISFTSFLSYQTTKEMFSFQFSTMLMLKMKKLKFNYLLSYFINKILFGFDSKPSIGDIF